VWHNKNRFGTINATSLKVAKAGKAFVTITDGFPNTFVHLKAV